MSELTRKERNAIAVVRKSIGSHGLAYAVDNELIALLPQSIVYYYFKCLMKALKKDASIRQINGLCRTWQSKACRDSSDSILLFFLEICSHEFLHFWADHAGRVESGEISQREAEAEAEEFQYKVAEMLRCAEIGEAVFQARKARLKKSGVR